MGRGRQVHLLVVFAITAGLCAGAWAGGVWWLAAFAAVGIVESVLLAFGAATGPRLLAAPLALVAGAALAIHGHYSADPSAERVRDAVAAIPHNGCGARLVVRDIHGIGGPGLPDGMLRAKEIVCDKAGRRGGRRVVIHYLFASGDDARRWLRDNDMVLGDAHYGWWLHGRTLIGDVDLGVAAYQRAVRELS